MRKTAMICTLGLVMFSQPYVHGQDEDKIKQLFQNAIQVLGGDTYLRVTDMTSDGNFFQFDREGNSSGLIKYSDYTKLPDRSRFELGNKRKELDVTVFNLEKNQGWILEGQKDTRDATPDEMKDFQSAVKHSIEAIFRFRYKNPENKLFYLGPSDDAVNLEMVKIIDPVNDEVTVYFDRLSRLPAKLEYQVIDARGIHYREVVEFSQWHMVQGVNTPMRMDTYRNGRQLSQQFVLKMAYNTGLQDSFFVKPVPPK